MGGLREIYQNDVLHDNVNMAPLNAGPKRNGSKERPAKFLHGDNMWDFSLFVERDISDTSDKIVSIGMLWLRWQFYLQYNMIFRFCFNI